MSTTPTAAATSAASSPAAVATRKRKLSEPSTPISSSPSPVVVAAAEDARSAEPAAGPVPPEEYRARVDRFRTATDLVKERNAVSREFTKTFTCDLVGLLGRSVRKMGSAEHIREVKTVTDAVERARSYQPLLLIENFYEFLAQPFAAKFTARDFDYFLNHKVFADESARVLDAHFAREGAGDEKEKEKQKEELRTVVNKVFGVMIDVIVFLKSSHEIAWTQIQDQLVKMFDLSVKYAYLRTQT